MTKQLKYFDPETLAKLHPFRLRARTLVEGLISGLHRSPLRGHSVEFAQHREYAPGDDLRQVDWKVYARSDRYYLKQYEDETNLIVYVLLDQSQSMSYQGDDSSLSKLEYARLVAFSLAHLVISQQDSVGFAAFAETMEEWLPPASSPAMLDALIRVMETPGKSSSTNIQGAIAQSVERASKPSLFFLISDLLEDVSKTLAAVSMLRHAGHDVIVIQVLDADEIQFPFDQTTQFEGLEEISQLVTDPLMIAKAYRQAAKRFQNDLSIGVRKLGADFHAIQTNESIGVILSKLLSQRQAGGT